MGLIAFLKRLVPTKVYHDDDDDDGYELDESLWDSPKRDPNERIIDLTPVEKPVQYADIRTARAMIGPLINDNFSEGDYRVLLLVRRGDAAEICRGVLVQKTDRTQHPIAHCFPSYATETITILEAYLVDWQGFLVGHEVFRCPACLCAGDTLKFKWNIFGVSSRS